MKVLSASEIKRIEKLAIQEGCSEEEFIRKAGEQIAKAAKEWMAQHQLPKHVIVFAGKGNNGADALAAGEILLRDGFEVQAYHLASLHQCRPLCRTFAERFCQKGGKRIEIAHAKDCILENHFLIIDGLIGSGFAPPLEDVFRDAIQAINQSNAPVLSVDIPSGLDATTGTIDQVAVQADLTVSLGFAKAGFFLADGWNYVGELMIADFGLPQKYIDAAREIAHLPEEADLQKMLPPLVRNRHKYQAGFVIGFAGSKHYSGAAKLSSLAALRSGAGIVKLFYPPEAESEMVDAPYEIVRLPWTQELWQEALAKAKSVWIGPGIGRSPAMTEWLEMQVSAISLPVVLDADALLPSIRFPGRCICTPHRQEMLRLLGKDRLSEAELMENCQTFADQKKIVLILKGAPTWIFSPQKKPFIIPRGDPGMASAGSGDVLTGIVASLLAQGCQELEASLLGAYLHALAGEAAARERTSYCMIAGDLIEFLSKSFLKLSSKNFNKH